MSLIQEFYSDHQEVVAALRALRQSVVTRDIPQVRTILRSAEKLVGCQFKVRIPGTDLSEYYRERHNT